MTGCPSLCIDIWEEHSFGHMTATKSSVLFIDSQSLRSNLDLSKYKSVKLLVINGQSQFSIISDADRIMYCDEIDNIRKRSLKHRDKLFPLVMISLKGNNGRRIIKSYR